MVEISEVDKDALRAIRTSVQTLWQTCVDQFDEDGLRVLDIAPQDHGGLKKLFGSAMVETLDIDPNSGADYISDLCNMPLSVLHGRYDAIMCSEVLEHVLRPFDAVDHLQLMLKPGGVLFASSPLNFRIHGPLPDCWRFTEHGLRSLFSKWSEISIDAIDSDRPLFPIHYTYRVKA